MSYSEQPKRYYHRDGLLPTTNVIFVFGSNLAGRHGKGAALIAKEQFGAVQGQGQGLQGKSYAIPTKGPTLHILSLPTISRWASDFCEFTYDRPDLRFFVTSVGCGLAGYTPDQIAPMFKRAINCSFPDTWKPWLEN